MGNYEKARGALDQIGNALTERERERMALAQLRFGESLSAWHRNHVLTDAEMLVELRAFANTMFAVVEVARAARDGEENT